MLTSASSRRCLIKRPSPQLKRRHPVDLVPRQLGCGTVIHPGAAEGLGELVAPSEFKRGGMVLRHVEKDRLSPGMAGEGDEQGIGDFGRFGEEGSDFETGPAGTDHAETTDPVAVEKAETEPSLRADPAAEKDLAGKPEMVPVEAGDLLEGKGPQFDERRIDGGATLPGAGETQVAVGEDEPAAGVEGQRWPAKRSQ